MKQKISLFSVLIMLLMTGFTKKSNLDCDIVVMYDNGGVSTIGVVSISDDDEDLTASNVASGYGAQTTFHNSTFLEFSLYVPSPHPIGSIVISRNYQVVKTIQVPANNFTVHQYFPPTVDCGMYGLLFGLIINFYDNSWPIKLFIDFK